MSDIILKVENISKQYRLGLVGLGTLAHDFNRFWHKIRGKEDPYLQVGSVNDRSAKASSDYVWALQDINFEIKRGEVLGIIGKNGAGKSTLLKILSRVTAPTTGSIKTRGTIASLLEVGTGMHPELTGRENIFLNGAILGMAKAEIASKIDEIIAFSGCEMYIDTPVKRYSSGMRVRLGFAVAAFLEPDILVVDEVLAVGDAEFQKKAIGKMQDISNTGGRTVLFVSHNMAAVKSLCTSGLIIENGKIIYYGSANDAVSIYLGGAHSEVNYTEYSEDFKTEALELKTIKAYDIKSPNDSVVTEKSTVVLEFNFNLFVDDVKKYTLTFHFKNETGETLFTFSPFNFGLELKKGQNSIQAVFPKDFIKQGTYYINLFLVEDRKRSIVRFDDVFSLQVIHAKRDIGVFMGKEPGYIKPHVKWLSND
ncbi:ABC transporter ATP-binding protein [Dokdonia pacifica]|uniref:Lipopolysaccharide transport system ATP-binding protein n=1 Tax=Dokdonia pacifica TaxID=1627892 RepID=A0A239BQN4_9FLAO|nr:ABC transporter ATP-binding protein [Dokdonia pacifica]GGG28151.1 ABC transporter ATP-binding protein [Dokdonia pacifica]SNS09972.1 lipopolysaccharide transport system ATP-binding protein [Dokdonia pacifica]